jgi:putative Ca2+/H+ antiporter (TMEM165/GDT1 family)
MDWKLMGLSFVTVFLAELGDKSQFAAIALSGSSKSPKAVFLGSVVALVLASFIGVWLGEGTAQFLPTQVTKTIAAIGFAVMAAKLIFFGEAEEEPQVVLSNVSETLSDVSETGESHD